MPVQPQRPKLRKREIAFALAMGGLAAGGGAMVLSAMHDDAGAPARFAPANGDRTYQVGEFDQITTEGPQDVVVTLGDTVSVRSEGSAEALELLEAVVEDGTLKIGPRKGFNWGNWRRLSGATFYVTVPQLEAVAQAGSGNIRIDRLDGESFEGTIAGQGELSIADMKVDDADFRIGGSGSIRAAGTAGATRVSIGGSGAVQGAGLRSRTASISISGQGDVALTVEDEARVSITGSGDVDISGPAKCLVTQFGSGDVRCAGGGGTD